MTTRKTPGKALVARIIADMDAHGLEADTKERELLRLAEGLADQLDGLRKSVAAEGYSTTLETGRIVANPAVALINSTSLALTKVLAGVQMTEPAPETRASARARRAANQRWHPQNNEPRRLG